MLCFETLLISQIHINFLFVYSRSKLLFHIFQASLCYRHRTPEGVVSVFTTGNYRCQLGQLLGCQHNFLGRFLIHFMTFLFCSAANKGLSLHDWQESGEQTEMSRKVHSQYFKCCLIISSLSIIFHLDDLYNLLYNQLQVAVNLPKGKLKPNQLT